MKKTVMVFAGLLMATANATATSMEPNVPMTRLHLNYYGKTYITTVDNSGLLTVAEKGAEGIVAKKQLKQETLNMIDMMAKGLATVQTKTTSYPIVCMMVAPAVTADSLQVSKLYPDYLKFTGKLRVILTDEGCYNHKHTQPTEEYALGNARMLRTVLETLTYETAELTPRYLF